MSKLRDMIHHHDTRLRSAKYPRMTLTNEQSGYIPHQDLEIWRAELRVGVDYHVNPLGAIRNEYYSQNAEAQLLVTLYGPLLKHIYALRSAVYSGDDREAHEIIARILDEVTP